MKPKSPAEGTARASGVKLAADGSKPTENPHETQSQRRPRNGRGQWQRGDRFERELVNALRERGLEVRRVPLSGSVEGYPGDVEVTAGFDGATSYRGECKRRKELPAWLAKALDGNDFVALRQDRGDTIILLRLDLFGDLLQ